MIYSLKGASEIVLTSFSKFYDFEQDKIIDITEEMRKKIDDEITKMANMALRTICVAYKEITGKEGKIFQFLVLLNW